mmetsp:Transcript_24581/g.50285  ORF Transcript_24581/g.50285 Transcript_24581/m.50285 type:complete len:227 (+) Transcript_24581:1814-2494(+)
MIFFTDGRYGFSCCCNKDAFGAWLDAFPCLSPFLLLLIMSGSASPLEYVDEKTGNENSARFRYVFVTGSSTAWRYHPATAGCFRRYDCARTIASRLCWSSSVSWYQFRGIGSSNSVTVTRGSKRSRGCSSRSSGTKLRCESLMEQSLFFPSPSLVFVAEMLAFKPEAPDIMTLLVSKTSGAINGEEGSVSEEKEASFSFFSSPMLSIEPPSVGPPGKFLRIAEFSM